MWNSFYCYFTKKKPFYIEVLDNSKLMKVTYWDYKDSMDSAYWVGRTAPKFKNWGIFNLDLPIFINYLNYLIKTFCNRI